MKSESFEAGRADRRAGGRGSSRLTSALLLLAGGLLVAGCDRGGNAASSASGGRSPGMAAPVTIATAGRADVPVRVEAIGAVEPYSTVTIKSRVAGQIVKIGFTQGQDVKKGDVLFEIDRRPFEAALAMAKANLARDIATARNAREEADFQADIFKRSAGTQREYDRAVAAAEAAEAQVRADQAAVANAQVQLDYCTIASPLDGRTGDLMVHEGSVVKNDDTAMVTINQVTPIYVAFSVPEKYLPRIRQYMTGGREPLAVDVTIPQTDVPSQRGELSFIDNQVDRTTGMIGLKGTFANTDGTLWPGQFVNVSLVLARLPDAVVVPAQAVQIGQDGQFVFVVKPDQTVESRRVTTGETWNNMTVIQRGIAVGETVVTDGQLRLVPGSKVTVNNGSATPPTSNPAARAE
jgi:multidrug efflux system membrane fusion protein